MYRVLAVDDDPGVITFVRNALKDEPYEVDTAESAGTAVERLETMLPDLLLLDLTLPGQDGFGLLRKIREERRYDFMSIVLLSASEDLPSKLEGLELGAVEYLVKPIHPRELAARVRALLRFKQRQDHIFAEYQRLSELSLTDPLTGAYNRRALEGLLRTRLAESARYDIPVSCVMFDIDHFKLVNDTYGHGTGDKVLKGISAITLAACRQEDALVRYGGEEFLIILFHTSRSGAHTFAERLRAQTADHAFRDNEQTIRITLSAGVACHPEDEGTREAHAMIGLADQRLYAAKRASRNRVVSEG
jgi:two-component system cell cycle response regulator